MNKVLFVCLGNICRSPAGEGVLRRRSVERGLDHLEIDSAGTGGWHVGAPADARMRSAAASRGYELTSRARQVTPRDLVEFDLVVAMDRENLRDLETLIAEESTARLVLLSDFLDDGWPRDVPDPYYGGDEGFERVLDMLETAADALLDSLEGVREPEAH